LVPVLEKANSRPDWAWIGLKRVSDPGRYGVAEIRGEAVIGIEEKPQHPKSELAVVGIYVYPPDVFGFIKTLRPSHRGELEVTDVNNHYLAAGRLGSFTLEGYWTDAGTLDSLDHANDLVRKEPPRF
jgi:glucose-1-phosphate thymidylyltransferase